LGQTLIGQRLRDLRSVIRYLGTRAELEPARIALWGDSFAPVNEGDIRVEVPWDADKVPAQSEPLGGLLALFGGLFEDDIRAISVNGGLVSYASLLESQFCFVPHDVIVPAALTTSDLSDVAAALQPRPVLLQGLVDGQNRRAKSTVAEKEAVAAWLVKQLK